MTKVPDSVIAVDWSGAMKGFRRKIWLAEVGAEGLTELEDGRSREQICDLLIQKARMTPSLVVGLDFAFSFPAWFVRDRGCTAGPDFWECARRDGEGWITPIRPPFFSKGGWSGETRRAYRATEWKLRNSGRSPETVFKLVGPTQVGRGSIRGMPILQKLRENGFNIWPFDSPKLPFVIEIYPGLFYPRGTKSSLEARMEYLKGYPDLEEFHRIKATCSDDAFDATVSALRMFERRDELARLPENLDDIEEIEGRIWF